MRAIKILLCALVLIGCVNFGGTASAAEEISKLILSKNEISLEVGDTQAVTATALYVSGKTEEVTIKADWTMSIDQNKPNEPVAAVYAGMVTAKNVGDAVLTTTFMGKTVTIPVHVTKKVKSLTKDRQSLDMQIGGKDKIVITAYYQDGSSEPVSEKAEWSTDNNEVLTVTNGQVTAFKSGKATITAKYGKLTISIPVSVEIARRLDLDLSQVSMLVKEKKPIKVTATFEDGSTKDVSGIAEWTTNAGNVADVIKGEIVAYGPGKATLTAKYGTKTASVQVDVDGTQKLLLSKEQVFMKVNTSEDLTLDAIFVDGSKNSITDKAEWTSSDNSIVYAFRGKLTAYKAGEATITVKYGDKTVSVTVDVEVPRRLDFNEGQKALSLSKGGTKQLTLTATYANGSTETITDKAEWSSSNGQVALVTKGLITAYESGETKITATYGGKSVSISVNVDIPSKLKADPSSIALQKGNTQQIKITSAYSDGRSIDVTKEVEWSTSSDAIAEIEDGLITAKDSGTATITAKYNSRSVTISVYVDQADKLEANIRTITLNAQETKQVKLTATDTKGNSTDVTDKAEWKSSSEKIADVNKGLVTGYSSGKATITAKYGGKTVSIPVEVDILQKLEANRRFISLKSNTTEQVNLTATYADGSTKDVTKEAEWKISSYKVADVDKGNVSGIAYGKTTLTAKYGSKSISIPVDVDSVKYLTTDRVNITMAKGSTAQILATATYIDGNEADVTIPALWKTSKLQTADVKNGTIRAHGKGKVVLTVTFGGKSTKVWVTVQ